MENANGTPRSPGKTVVDIVLLLLFAAAAGALGYWYLEPGKKPPVVPEGKPDASPTVDIAAMERLVRATPAAKEQTFWTPEKLSARWKRIIIHHSATSGGNGKIFDRWHRERGMENGLAYHFVITNGNGGDDGRVEIGKRWFEQLDGGHVRGDALNHESLGICLVGNFLHEMPTVKQIASCKALINYLRGLTGLPAAAVIGHKQAPGQKTVCPGCLPVELLRGE